MPDLEDNSDAFSNDSIFNRAYDDETVGAVAVFNNMDATINVSHIPTLRIHKDHPKDQILGDPKLAVQTRGKIQKDSSTQPHRHGEKSMCTEFEDCMHKRLQMSSMGELTFFLGLQVKQQPDGIFISQDKYVADILKKYDFWSIRTATTPIESNKPLVKDENGEDVDVHVYRSMIGSLRALYMVLS
ncbi:putative ribonuclease H-like domain-containing protein [Tanacetum coccineum]|uniref:Ribonuclease H-like domain-containing protein n=1 Tax=Tanacetum coccineum TaxID=301880 RepID=A0ABQ4XA21_9ASTR